MTSLRERLQGLGVRSAAPRDAAPESAQPPGVWETLQGVLGGRALDTARGECFVVDHSFPLHYSHGLLRLHDALDVRAGAWDVLCRDPFPRGFDLARALFVDTETTGLAGGTGTHAFLVGVGTFDGRGFTVRQFFLRDYHEEQAMLLALHDLLGQGAAFVTFNGKMFDLPLLQTRYIAARVGRAFPAYPHLDLLHPARRLWKGALPDCRLGTLDRAILGLNRADDVPGWQVPALYVDYLRTGRAEPLRGVLEHNLHDILSLVTLAGYMGRVGADPVGTCPNVGPDLLSRARLLGSAGRPAEAMLLTRRALRLFLSAEARRQTLLAHATYSKAAGYLDEAVQCWELLALKATPEGVLACTALAIYQEHRCRDRAAALRYAEQALAAAPGCAPRLVEPLAHRVDRLRRPGGPRSASNGRREAPRDGLHPGV